MRLSQEEDGDSLEDPGAPGHYVGEDYDFTELYSRFTGFEDVSCDVCTYSTARMGNMRRHVLAVHQGVRFPCNLCNYRAPDKGSLLRHTRGVHQGIRYYCDFCSYSATQKGNLKKHQGMKHKDNNYSCMYCTFQVNWKGSFIKHLQNQHGDLMAAQGLGTTGETNPLLSFNVNLSSQEEEDVGELGENGSALNCSFQCPLCNYTANSSASLARHNGAVHKGGSVRTVTSSQGTRVH